LPKLLRRPIHGDGQAPPIIDIPSEVTKLIDAFLEPKPFPCAYLELKINEDSADALIDSGSSYSFVDANFREDLEKQGFKFVPKLYNIRVADKRWIQCEGYMLMKFKIKNRIFTYPFILMKDTIQPVILGIDFLSWAGLCLSFLLIPGSG